MLFVQKNYAWGKPTTRPGITGRVTINGTRSRWTEVHRD